MTEKSLKTLVITSWVVLFFCFVFKLFGFEIFEFNVENIKFVEFCNFVDTRLWLKMIIACVNFIITTTPMICIMLNKKCLNKKEMLIFIPLMITKSIISWFVGPLSSILDIVIMIILPLVIGKFKNYKRVILTVCLVLFFQVMTLMTRSTKINEYFNEQDALISLLLQIDYVIMVFISYFYNCRLLLRKEA